MNPMHILLIIAAVGAVTLFVGLCIAALAIRLFIGIAQVIVAPGARTTAEVRKAGFWD